MQFCSKKENRQRGLRLSTFRAISFASALIALPAGNIAHAQPLPQTQPAASQSQPTTQKAKAEYIIEERADAKEPTIKQLRVGRQNYDAYYTYGSSAGKGDPKPAIKFKGPARVTVELYPIINRKRQSDGDTLTLSYLLDGKVHARDEILKISDIGVQGADLEKFGIALPLKIEFTTGKGEHELLLLNPVGFIRIVKVEEITQSVPQTQPVEITPKKKEPVQEEKRLLFQAAAKRLEFSLGKNKGDINELDGYATVKRLGRRFGLIAGAHFSSYGVSSLSSDGTAGLRTGSFNLGVGLSLSAGGHTVAALPFAGVRLVKPSFSDLQVSGEQGLEFGGTVWYGYRDRIGMVASGSNNPANPVSLSAYAILPYGWVKEFYPRLDLDVRWLHLFGNSRMENDYMLVSLNQNNVLGRAVASIPLVKIPRIPLSIVPSAIAGVELSKSGYEGTFVGGALSVKTQRLLLELGGAVVVDRPDHRLIFFLGSRIR